LRFDVESFKIEKQDCITDTDNKIIAIVVVIVIAFNI
jgi:hypothetical protein